jgi:hypothetical protein
VIEQALLEHRLKDAEERLEKACDEIIDLRAQLKLQELERGAAVNAIDALEAQNRELTGVHLFWKSAAEHALRLWGQAQDENDKLAGVLDRIVGHSATALSHELWTAAEAALEE